MVYIVGVVNIERLSWLKPIGENFYIEALLEC
jgi:hypothetical protein